MYSRWCSAVYECPFFFIGFFIKSCSISPSEVPPPAPRPGPHLLSPRVFWHLVFEAVRAVRTLMNDSHHTSTLFWSTHSSLCRASVLPSHCSVVAAPRHLWSVTPPCQAHLSARQLAAKQHQATNQRLSAPMTLSWEQREPGTDGDPVKDCVYYYKSNYCRLSKQTVLCIRGQQHLGVHRGTADKFCYFSVYI